MVAWGSSPFALRLIGTSHCWLHSPEQPREEKSRLFIEILEVTRMLVRQPVALWSVAPGGLPPLRANGVRGLQP